MTSLTFDDLHVLHNAVVVDFEALRQLLENGHVAIGDESMAARELGEVVVVVPVERGDLLNGRGREREEERSGYKHDRISLRFCMYLIQSCSTGKFQVAIVKIKQPRLFLI